MRLQRTTQEITVVIYGCFLTCQIDRPPAKCPKSLVRLGFLRQCRWLFSAEACPTLLCPATGAPSTSPRPSSTWSATGPPSSSRSSVPATTSNRWSATLRSTSGRSTSASPMSPPAMPTCDPGAPLRLRAPRWWAKHRGRSPSANMTPPSRQASLDSCSSWMPRTRGRPPGSTAQKSAAGRRLAALRQRTGKAHGVRTFTEPATLAAEVLAALSRARRIAAALERVGTRAVAGRQRASIAVPSRRENRGSSWSTRSTRRSTASAWTPPVCLCSSASPPRCTVASSRAALTARCGCGTTCSVAASRWRRPFFSSRLQPWLTR